MPKAFKFILALAMLLILYFGVMSLYKLDAGIDKVSAAIGETTEVSVPSPSAEPLPEPTPIPASAPVSSQVFADNLGHLAYCTKTPAPTPAPTQVSAFDDNLCHLAYCAIVPEPTPGLTPEPTAVPVP